MPNHLPELNTKLFGQILDVIEKHPEHHDQNDFENPRAECGTTRCVAGWAIFIDATNRGENITSYIQASSMPFGVAPSTVAGRLLGITPQEREELFYRVDNSGAVDLVRRYAAGKRS